MIFQSTPQHKLFDATFPAVLMSVRGQNTFNENPLSLKCVAKQTLQVWFNFRPRG